MTGSSNSLTASGRCAAAAVVSILDGLDELSEDARTAVIAALNGSLADRDQFILTSRTGELATAIEQAGDVLTAAAVIAPRPLTPQAAADYLRTCLPPGPPPGWAPVLDALEDARLPGLAEVASTALGLWLIRTVYVTTAVDPGPLTGPLADDPAALRAHLFDQLIPATIRTRRPTRDPAEHFRPRHAWNPDQVRDYLAYLARLLTTLGTRDLAWWHLARHTTTTRSQRRRTALTVGLVVGLVAWLMTLLLGGLVFGLGIGLVVGLVGGLIDWAEHPARTTATTPLSTWKGDRTLTFLRIFIAGLVVGLVVGLVLGPVAGVAVAIAVGLLFGNHHAWLAYMITIGGLAKAGHVPWNLMAFLDDAHRLGLLRTVGPICQFRHAELQDHLAALPPEHA